MFKLFSPRALAAVVLALCGSAHAIDLTQYQWTATHALPEVKASEASAVTWNWDTGTLFVVGDEGEYVVEVNTQGQELSAMRLFGFDDTEGLTYVGNGQFVVVEERLQSLHLLTYQGGSLAGRAALPSVAIGPTIGNTGLEGASYDRVSGDLFLVKEKAPQALYRTTWDLSSTTASTSDLVPRANPFSRLFDTLDLADVQVLSSVPALQGTAWADRLLVLSQETPRLMVVGLDGQVFSQFDLSGLATDIEGVTIDAQGTIYLVGETPALYVLSAAVPAVPEPSSIALLLAGVAVTAATRFRRS